MLKFVLLPLQMDWKFKKNVFFSFSDSKMFVLLLQVELAFDKETVKGTFGDHFQGSYLSFNFVYFGCINVK